MSEEGMRMLLGRIGVLTLALVGVGVAAREGDRFAVHQAAAARGAR